jgi:hypothetical protein
MTRTRSYAPWVALQIRPKMERTVAEHLSYRGYEHFPPLRHPEYVRSQYPAAEYHLAYSASGSHVGAIV